jgi:multidrug efflux pump subunit AcrB
MAKFFIDRPVFAIVIAIVTAIVTVILGAAAIPNLPIATYPEVVPPVVQVTANFRGANSQGATGGFELMLQDRSDGDLAQLSEVTQAFVQAARQRPEIASINTGLRTTVPQFRVDLDTDKAQTLGVPVTDVYSALQTFLGGLYVDDFNRFGRTWRVLMQAEPQFRVRPDDINQFHVRGRDADMIPLSTLVSEARVGSGSGLSLQPVPRRAADRQQRAGFQLRPGGNCARTGRARSSAARIRL